MHKEIESILDNWVEKINQDEFYLAHSFDRIIEKKNSAEAFEYIPHIIDAILETNDDFIASQLIFYLDCLYGKADTAEIHHAFITKKEELEGHINNLDGDDSEREYLEFKRDLNIK